VTGIIIWSTRNKFRRWVDQALRMIVETFSWILSRERAVTVLELLNKTSQWVPFNNTKCNSSKWWASMMGRMDSSNINKLMSRSTMDNNNWWIKTTVIMIRFRNRINSNKRFSINNNKCSKWSNLMQWPSSSKIIKGKLMFRILISTITSQWMNRRNEIEEITVFFKIN